MEKRMEITKVMQECAKFASTSEIRAELACVMTDGRKAVATDSFRLMEITRKERDGIELPKAAKKPWLVFAKELLKVKHDAKGAKVGVLKGDGESGKGEVHTDVATFPVRIHTYHADAYPKYESIVTDAEKEESSEMTFNAEYLKEICATMEKIGDGHITIRFPKAKGRPILITNEDDNHAARALLMPFNR
jgi:hypothetical protein